MSPFRRRFLLALFGLAVTTPAPGAKPTTPAEEIEQLLQRVANARGVVFIRNGSEHTAADAAAHLRRKLGAVKGRIKTPEQFIDKLATRSSMTGKAYRVRLPDGREVESAAWFNTLLRELRQGR